MFILAILPFQINAQGLTLDQLISFQKKDVSEINDILIGKGWSFSNSTEETTDNYGVTKWSYDKNKWEEGKAQAWLTQSFGQDLPSRIVYQISSKPVYLAIKQSIISYKMRKVNSKVGDNKIITDYQGKNYTVRIESINNESNDISYYTITIFAKVDYESMMLSKSLESFEETSENDNSSSQSVKDIDGNEYTTVRIGTQTWLVENLKVSHYRNGDPIQNITENSRWSSLSTGAWCYYNNNEIYDRDYGKLYNWYAVNDSRNIAPIGWHVPTESEISTLINYLGGDKVARGKLIQTGTSHWNEFDSEATNSSRFSALPGGCRNERGSFNNDFGFSPFGNVAYWWCSTNKDTFTACYLLIAKFGLLRSNGSKLNGYSIRCVKDK